MASHALMQGCRSDHHAGLPPLCSVNCSHALSRSHEGVNNGPARLSHNVIQPSAMYHTPPHRLPSSFPQSPEAEARGSLQLLDSFDAKTASTPQAGVAAMPHGFMEDFAARYESDGLDQIMTPIGAGQRGRGPAGRTALPSTLMLFSLAVK